MKWTAVSEEYYNVGHQKHILALGGSLCPEYWKLSSFPSGSFVNVWAVVNLTAVSDFYQQV